MGEQQHHDDAGSLHDVHGERRAGEAANTERDHGIAADEQQRDAPPHQGKEAAEDTLPEPEPRLGGKLTAAGRNTR